LFDPPPTAAHVPLTVFEIPKTALTVTTLVPLVGEMTIFVPATI